MDIKMLGPKAAAEFRYMEGEGLNSNPYQQGTKDHDAYSKHIHNLQRRELKREIQDMMFGGA